MLYLHVSYTLAVSPITFYSKFGIRISIPGISTDSCKLMTLISNLYPRPFLLSESSRECKQSLMSVMQGQIPLNNDYQHYYLFSFDTVGNLPNCFHFYMYCVFVIGDLSVGQEFNFISLICMIKNDFFNNKI